MKAVKARIVRSIPVGARIAACDNSGAKVVRLISVKGLKTVKNRYQSAAVGDLVNVSVISGKQDMKKQVLMAVIVRQKKEYRRPDGMRVKFEDNSAVILKDDKGNPKGTIFKGPIAKEAAERWPAIAKLASTIA